MIKETSEILQHYIRAVNILDDYFEYRYLLHSQGENREYVMKTLDDLTKELERKNDDAEGFAQSTVQNFASAPYDKKQTFMKTMVCVADDLGKLAFAWLSCTNKEYVQQRIETAFAEDWEDWFCRIYSPNTKLTPTEHLDDK